MPTPFVTNKPFDEEYIEATFYAWYEAGRPRNKSIRDCLPEREDGKPARSTVDDWIKNYGWIERADALDVQRSNLLDQRAIERRADMLERQAKIGKALLDKGYEYIEENEPASIAEAVKLVVEGKNMERESLGYSEILKKYSRMQNTELDQELRKLLGTGEDEDIIEGDSVDVTEIINDAT
uniref:Uncharacterized protein n=1 Tax=viral metagenome TaxID=1070528 RepID=A0A6H1ZBA6_9ZZZZ